MGAGGRLVGGDLRGLALVEIDEFLFAAVPLALRTFPRLTLVVEVRDALPLPIRTPVPPLVVLVET